MSRSESIEVALLEYCYTRDHWTPPVRPNCEPLLEVYLSTYAGIPASIMHARPHLHTWNVFSEQTPQTRLKTVYLIWALFYTSCSKWALALDCLPALIGPVKLKCKFCRLWHDCVSCRRLWILFGSSIQRMIKDAFRKADDMAQEVSQGFKDKGSCSPVSSVSREGRKPHNNGFGDSSGWSWSRNMNCGFWGGGTGRHLWRQSHVRPRPSTANKKSFLKSVLSLSLSRSLWCVNTGRAAIRQRAVVRCSVSGLVLIIIPDLGLIRATQDIPMDRTQCGF